MAQSRYRPDRGAGGIDDPGDHCGNVCYLRGSDAGYEQSEYRESAVGHAGELGRVHELDRASPRRVFRAQAFVVFPDTAFQVRG